MDKKIRDSVRELLFYRLETLSSIKKFLEFDFLHGSINNNMVIGRNFELLNLFPNLNLEIAKDIEIELCKKSTQ